MTTHLNPDAVTTVGVVVGRALADVAEIDARLLGLCWWRTHHLRTVDHAPPGRRELCRARFVERYEHDRDVLLDRRLWLQT